MIKSRLIFIVAGQFRYIRQRAVEQAVDTIFDQMAAALANGDRVELRGFGSFSVRVRGGRVGRNPRTGTKIHVSDKKVFNFRQSNEMHRRLNFVLHVKTQPIPHLYKGEKWYSLRHISAASSRAQFRVRWYGSEGVEWPITQSLSPQSPVAKAA